MSYEWAGAFYDPGPMKVLVCDALAAEALDVFRDYGIETVVETGLSEDELVERADEFDGLAVRSATKVTARVLDAGGRLKVVGRAGVGVDNVDCEHAAGRGVLVMNTPTGNTVTTAEMAIALLFALARHVPTADAAVRSGTWKKIVGCEITGKILGVVGLGRIGRVVAARGAGIGMRVIGFDPLVLAGKAVAPEGVEMLELDALLSVSDFVTLHVPLMDATRGLISAERIQLMKPGARLINGARGGLVDEAAVVAALDAGHLAGAAFDVLAEEPPALSNVLIGRDDVIVTPHMGASSVEAGVRVATDVAHQISRYLLDGKVENAVNTPEERGGEL